ncbi:MAG TPA: hypothetical protein VI072_03540 [Polyangiaceae bacterium]
MSLVAAAVGTMVGCSLVMGEVPAKDRAGLTDQDAGDSGVRDSSEWDTSIEADADAAEASVQDATPEVGPCADGAPEQVFFEDRDGDGYGVSNVTRTGCEPPSTGTWAIRGRDCNDNHADVHPEQPDYFEQPWRVDEERFSFDYDCSGIESAKPGQSQAPSACTGLCSGVRGFKEAPARVGIGLVDPYCGSNVIRECALITCTLSEMTGSVYFVCK